MARDNLPILGWRAELHSRGLLLNKPGEHQKGCGMYIWDYKKRWHNLNNGMMFGNIAMCEKIFVTCCCLHNILLNLMERNDICVGRGAPLGENNVWLDGHTTPPSNGTSDRMDAFWFGQCRTLLAMHLNFFWEKGPIESTCGWRTF
jgi:hypothetical protein